MDADIRNLQDRREIPGRDLGAADAAREQPGDTVGAHRSAGGGFGYHGRECRGRE